MKTRPRSEVVPHGGSVVEPTEPLRRHAVWLFPGAFLLHALVVYGVYPVVAQASLVAAVAAVAGGVAIRWVHNLTTLLGLAVFLIAFLMLYVMGIAAPIAFLAISDHRDWIPWSGLASTTLLLGILSWRIRVSLRNEWSAPLDRTPGVEVDMNERTLRRQPPESQASFANTAAWVMLVILVPMFFLATDASAYRLVAIVLGPVCVAILGTEFVARGLTYCWIARRWEIAHGMRFRVPPSSRSRGA